MSLIKDNKVTKYIKENFEVVFFYSLVALVSTLIVSMRGGFRWNSWSIILISLVWLIGKSTGFKIATIYKNKFVLLNLAYFFLFVFGLLYTENFKDAKHGIEVRMSFLALPLVVSTSAQIVKKYFDKILFSFLLTNLIVSLFLFTNGEAIFSDFLFMVSKLIMHRPYFGMYIVFCIAISAYLISRSSTWKVKLLYLLLIAYFIWFLTVIQVRMASIALVISGFTVLMFYLINKKKYVIVAFTLMIAAISGYFAWTKIPVKYKDLIVSAFHLDLVPYHLYSVNVGHSYNLRMLTWQCALEIMANNLLLGVGTGDNTDELVECYKDKNEYIYEQRFNSHNEYFQETLRHGLIGLFVFISNIALSFYYAIKNRSMLYLFFIMLVSICFITEAVLSRQAGVVFYTAFSSILFSNYIAKD